VARRSEAGQCPAGGDLRPAAARTWLDWRRAMAVNPPTISFDGQVPARAGLSGCVPDEPGVYVFADFRGVLYVGRTDCLRRRFAQHLEGSHNRWLTAALSRPLGAVSFGWVLTGPAGQPSLERSLISTFRPLCNLAMNRS